MYLLLINVSAFISIHSPRMGRDAQPFGCALRVDISIHSPRMGRDGATRLTPVKAAISIHSPRMGRDVGIPCSTQNSINFNPLSPHGERLLYAVTVALPVDFNPLSPHGERPREPKTKSKNRRFQSTLPAWGETVSVCR